MFGAHFKKILARLRKSSQRQGENGKSNGVTPIRSMRWSYPLVRQLPRKHILEIAIRVMPVHACRLIQAHDCRSPFSAAQRPCEEQVFASKPPWPNLVFRPIVVYGYGPVIEVARQRCPAFQAVIECSADGR